MALNTSKCNDLTPLRFKGLKILIYFGSQTTEDSRNDQEIKRLSGLTAAFYGDVSIEYGHLGTYYRI